jgi:hypothetical protein
MRGKGIDAMATAGQASIHAAIGLALIAPLLVRTIAGRLSRPLERAGASGYLTAHNVRRRTHEMAGALMPIILVTATAGALYMQSIENAAPPVAGTATSAAEAENVETLNFVVVGMIAAFAAIMLINTVVTATNHRRQEFAQLRLAGATPPQVLQMVSLESIVLLVTGIAFGTVAALFTIVPYNIARTGSLVPDSTIAIYLGVVGAAAIVALAPLSALRDGRCGHRRSRRSPHNGPADSRDPTPTLLRRASVKLTKPTTAPVAKQNSGTGRRTGTWRRSDARSRSARLARQHLSLAVGSVAENRHHDIRIDLIGIPEWDGPEIHVLVRDPASAVTARRSGHARRRTPRRSGRLAKDHHALTREPQRLSGRSGLRNRGRHRRLHGRGLDLLTAAPGGRRAEAGERGRGGPPKPACGTLDVVARTQLARCVIALRGPPRGGPRGLRRCQSTWPRWVDGSAPVSAPGWASSPWSPSCASNQSWIAATSDRSSLR